MSRSVSVFSVVVVMTITVLATVVVAFAQEEPLDEPENEGGGGPVGKVSVCHNTEHNPHTITVGAPAVAAHLAHGDTEGACTDEPGAPEPPDGATLTTEATDTATLPDGTISDTATLSGATSDATGTISFSAYGPFDPATDPTTDVCDETTRAFESPDPVDIGSPDASGNYVVSSDDPAVTTDDFVPTEAGRYQWVASYSGDDANDPVTSECNAEGEQSVVNGEGATTLALTTEATDTATLPDGTISDTATLSGATSDATGTISFSAYGPFDPATDPTTDVCDETTRAFESPDPVDIGSPDASGNYVVSSDDPAVTTDDFVPTEAGRYQWVASYSGDDANDPVTSECNAEGEQSVVNEASSTTGTEQNMTLAGEVGEAANLADPATDTTNIEGTTQNGNTTLGADSEDDVLYGDASANKLLGRHGNDYLDGGKGRDRMVGGKQADRINGADGKPGDVINGGIGIDYCVGDVGDEIKNCDGNVVNVPLPSEAAAPAEARH